MSIVKKKKRKKFILYIKSLFWDLGVLQSQVETFCLYNKKKRTELKNMNLKNYGKKKFFFIWSNLMFADVELVAVETTFYPKTLESFHD